MLFMNKTKLNLQKTLARIFPNIEAVLTYSLNQNFCICLLYGLSSVAY